MAGDRTRSAIFFGLYAAMLLYGLYWVRLSHVRDRVGNLTLFCVLIGAALCYVIVRAVLVVIVKVSEAWDPVWVAIDLIIITVAVRLTGGIDSEAALLYFWPIATYAILRHPIGTLLVGLASASLYVAATWPGGFPEEYSGSLGTRLLILAVVTVVATSFAILETRRVEEMARLREQVGIAEYRRSLAQEMHDGIQHYLTAISTRLQMAERMLAGDPARAARMAVDQRFLVNQAADELRYLVRRLRSPAVERQDFLDGLREHLVLFRERSPMAVSVDIEGEPVPIPPDVEQAAFRIVQEALMNAEKHAQADEVSVTVRLDHRLLECVISDNGVGFDPSQVGDQPRVEGGFGLPSMRQRADQVGGRLQIASTPGEGAVVTFTVALDDDTAPAPHAEATEEA
ncbi:MAG: sensor histidine kinase [Armatimonadota bacterium]